ncbi:bacillithiol biosynthesis protein BshC [Dyadobacter fermentans]|nr:bacillithiol biosynthesis BshC [Dyadobacter fermentans]
MADHVSPSQHFGPDYSLLPTIESFGEHMSVPTGFDRSKREMLAEVLSYQYKGLPNQPDFSVLLRENTFVVAAFDGLNIFTGTLSFIYKIITTIRLAHALQAAYPECQFVPLFVMDSESDDFRAIASFNAFGHTFRWQDAHQGPVGSIDPASLRRILNQLPAGPLLFAKSYLENSCISNAVRAYMHELFGHYGLITLDPDNAMLKAGFSKTGQHGMEGLLSANRPPSTDVNLNLFFSASILPVRAVVGDVTQFRFWLEQKKLFDQLHMPFPTLVPRNQALIVKPAHLEKLQKFNVTWETFFEQNFCERIWYDGGDKKKSTSFSEEKKLTNQAFDAISDHVGHFGADVMQVLELYRSDFANSLRLLERRIHQAEQRRWASRNEQLTTLKNKLFPNGVDQERFANLLDFYWKDPHFIQKLYNTFDPLDFRYNVLLDE